ncbi:hypothetical protein [Demequina aestuarii]|uniref:hypothetical protein n=1 Tax=Demequina aestuarii TaxID=327095 RepID=UPI00128BFA22|nr:hypothetical protein [Demequina aestuarii]
MIGTAFMALAMAPIAIVPLFGDDFEIAALHDLEYHGSLLNVMAQGWWGDLQSNRFNPVGREFSLGYHVFAREAGAITGADPQTFYRLGTWALGCASALAAAFTLVHAARFVSARNALALAPTYAAICAAVAVTLHLHFLSHDPTLTIAEIGYGVVVLSLWLIGLGFRALRPNVPLGRAVWPFAVLSMAGTLFYETFVTAVAAMALVFVVVLGRERRWRLLGWLLGAGALLPAAVFLAGRWWVNTYATDVAQYSGTELQLSAGAARTFALYTAGTVPGASWRHAAAVTGGPMFVAPAMITATLTAALLIATLVLLRRWRSLPRLVPSRRLWLVLAVLAIHVAGTYGAQSASPKYITTIYHLGVVYLGYATGVLVAAMLAVGALLFLPRRIARVTAVVLVVIAIPFTYVQHALNWAVATEIAGLVTPNDRITTELSRGALAEPERCELLHQWVGRDSYFGTAPDLMATIFESLDARYETHHGEPFCASDAPEIPLEERPSVTSPAAGPAPEAPQP